MRGILDFDCSFKDEADKGKNIALANSNFFSSLDTQKLSLEIKEKNWLFCWRRFKVEKRSKLWIVHHLVIAEHVNTKAKLVIWRDSLKEILQKEKMVLENLNLNIFVLEARSVDLQNFFSWWE